MPVNEGCLLTHVLDQEIEVSKELNFNRASLNGLCVSAHMVDSFFTEHVAVNGATCWLHQQRTRREQGVPLWRRTLGHLDSSVGAPSSGQALQCPGANACLPGACADKTSDYSHSCSCPDGCEERVPAQNANTIATGRVVAYSCHRHADHAYSSAIKFEDTVLCECNSGYSLDGTLDGNKSFTTTCGAAASGSMPVSPTGGEAFFRDVVRYSCEEVHTVTGMPGGSNTFERSLRQLIGRHQGTRPRGACRRISTPPLYPTSFPSCCFSD